MGEQLTWFELEAGHALSDVVGEFGGAVLPGEQLQTAAGGQRALAGRGLQQAPV